MDGVVIDSEKLYSLSEKKLLMQYGVRFDSSDWNYIKGCTESQFYDLVYDKYSPPIDRNRLITQGRAMLKKIFTEQLEYMNGFEDIYLKLRDQYRLALVTSTSLELVDHIDQFLFIKEKFDIIITSNDTQRHKPLPDPYIKAASELNFNPKDCLVVEDSIQGVKSGVAAGCRVVALEGSIKKEYLKEADCIISCLTDIQNIL